MFGGLIWGAVADIASIRIALLGAGLGTLVLNLLTAGFSLRYPEAPTVS
jgi:hypothetical protein